MTCSLRNAELELVVELVLVQLVVVVGLVLVGREQRYVWSAFFARLAKGKDLSLGLVGFPIAKIVALRLAWSVLCALRRRWLRLAKPSCVTLRCRTCLADVPYLLARFLHVMAGFTAEFLGARQTC